jgi:hypothetical protein
LARSHPCPPKTQIGPVCGLVPSFESSPGCVPAISGKKRVFVNEFLQLSPSRASVSSGKKRDSGPKAAEMPSPLLKRRLSPPVSPQMSLQDRMDLAASSLAALRHSAPTLVGLPSVLEVFVACSVSLTCMVNSPLALVSLSPVCVVSSLTSLATPMGVISPNVVSSVPARKVHKVAQKAHSVTHFVLSDDTNLGAGSILASSTSEAAGSTMPLPVSRAFYPGIVKA